MVTNPKIFTKQFARFSGTVFWQFDGCKMKMKSFIKNNEVSQRCCGHFSPTPKQPKVIPVSARRDLIALEWYFYYSEDEQATPLIPSIRHLQEELESSLDYLGPTGEAGWKQADIGLGRQYYQFQVFQKSMSYLK